MLSLNPLPPAKRKEIPAVLAMGLSFLLHGVLVVSLLAAALALPDYLPVQSGGVLTVSWAPAGTGTAGNTDMANLPDRTSPQLPEQAAKAILAERLCDTMFLNQIDTETQRSLADRFAAALGGSGLRIAAGSLRAGSGWLYPDI